MDPHQVFCHNDECPARGQAGKGNIVIHGKQRYKCKECGKTFTHSQGTMFYRLRYSEEFVTQMVTLIAYGCPIAAIVAAFRIDERTIADWVRRAGEHCQKVHEYLIEQPRDLGQVQADEIRVKMQGGIAWMAMAVEVSTRLWLGGVVSATRDSSLISELISKVKRCTLYAPLLFCVDGLAAYVSSITGVFRAAVRTKKQGRPRMRQWDNVSIVQVIKRKEGRRVVDVVRRVALGTQAQVDELLRRTQSTIQAHVSYIERLNATFRSRISALVRRGRSLAREIETLHYGMYLVGCVYNFCATHRSLRLTLYLPGNRHRWVRRSPALAAGITDHTWSVHELLSYKVPLPKWQPPKRRGRKSKNMIDLIRRYDL